MARTFFQIHPAWSLKEIVAAGQRLESRVLVKAVKLYLAKRLDVYWGTVTQGESLRETAEAVRVFPHSREHLAESRCQ